MPSLQLTSFVLPLIWIQQDTNICFPKEVGNLFYGPNKWRAEPNPELDIRLPNERASLQPPSKNASTLRRPSMLSVSSESCALLEVARKLCPLCICFWTVGNHCLVCRQSAPVLAASSALLLRL